MKRDQKFFDMYSVVIGALAIFALAIYVGAKQMSKLTQGMYSTSGEEYRDSVNERLAPFGQVYLPGEELTAEGPRAPATDPAPPVATTMSGPQVYNDACNVCHGAGIAGAPILSDTAAWEPRVAQGADVLKEHAINGYSGSVGFMPPKGGKTTLSDDEVAAAVDFMLGEVSQ